MSQYLILIYDNESSREALTGERISSITAGHRRFAEKHGSAILGGNALQLSSTATCVRPDGDSHSVTDGPFVETKEGLGGYYLVEAADLDAAIELAKDVPTIDGGIEIRPIRVLD